MFLFLLLCEALFDITTCIHAQALLSHNNLHTGNIFVRETTWCWKIGGFECALELNRVDAKVCIAPCVLCISKNYIL